MNIVEAECVPVARTRIASWGGFVACDIFTLASDKVAKQFRNER